MCEVSEPRYGHTTDDVIIPFEFTDIVHLLASGPKTPYEPVAFVAEALASANAQSLTTGALGLPETLPTYMASSSASVQASRGMFAVHVQLSRGAGQPTSRDQLGFSVRASAISMRREVVVERVLGI